MRFAVGLFDHLFGEKVSLEVPTSDGQTRRRTVTRRWLEQMEQEKKMQEVVRVHHQGLHGYSVEHWVIGQDISPDHAQRWRDPQTNEIYVMSFMKKGAKQTCFLRRDKWEEMKATLAEKGFG